MFFASYMGLSCFGLFCIGVDFSECAVEASRIYIPEYGKPSTYRITLTTKPEIKKTVFYFALLCGEKC